MAYWWVGMIRLIQMLTLVVLGSRLKSFKKKGLLYLTKLIPGLFLLSYYEGSETSCSMLSFIIR